MTPPADAEYAVFATVLLGSDKPDGINVILVNDITLDI